MKKYNVHFGSFLMLFFVFISNSFANQEAVEETVHSYLDGISNKNEIVLNDLISPDASLIGFNNIIDKQDKFDKENYIKAIKNGKIEGWADNVDIKMTNVQENIAVVMLEKSNSRLLQKEFVTLAFIEGKWKITGLVYSFDKN